MVHLQSYECARCGMAVPIEASRCPSCRARRRRAAVVVPSARSGPAAAEAWAARPPRPPVTGTALAGDVRATRPVGPGAVATAVALHLVTVAGVALAAVQVGRLVLAVAVDDNAELAASGSWETFGDLATVTVAIAAAVTMVATVLVVGWSAVAGLNVRPLGLDPRQWVHGLGRVAGRVLLLAALATTWGWAPGRPDQADRVLELVVAVATALALAAAALATRRFVLAVSAAELRRAELLVRAERAAAITAPGGPARS